MKVPSVKPLCLWLLGQIFTFASLQTFHYLSTLESPKGLSSHFFFFFNSLKEIWSSGITPPPLVFDRPRPPLPHMPQDTAGEEGGWLLGRGGDVTSTCHLVSSLTSPSPRQPHPPSLPGGLTWPSHPHAPLPEQARPSRPSLLPPSNGRGAGLAEQAAAA